MSDDQKENPEKPRVRKIVRSAVTSDQAAFIAPEPAPASPPPAAEGAKPSGAEQAPASAERKWDVRAERKPGDAPRPPRGPRRPPGRGPGFGPRPDGAPGDANGAPTGADSGMPERPRRFTGPRRPLPLDRDGTPLRAGASGGRAMPEYRRGPIDRSSAEFVDKWMNMPPRNPDEPRPPRRDRERRPGDGTQNRPGEGRPGEGRSDGKPTRAMARPPMAPRRPEPPPAPVKLPTLHETILVGLPRVSMEEQRAQSAKPKTAKEALLQKTAKSNQAEAAPKAKAEAKGEVILDTAWLTADADNAVAALKASGPAADALVDAWMKSNNVAAIAETGSCEDVTGNARKAARRALSVLRAKGVAIPERKKVAVTSPMEEETIEATFTPPDGRGTVSITIAKRKGNERAHIAEVLMREGTGVVTVASGWMSRSQIKEAHQRIADATGVAPAPVPVDWVRHLVENALKENAKSGQLVPIGIEGCKELLKRVGDAGAEHPLAELDRAISIDGDPAGLAPSSLHQEPEFRGWVPDPRAIDEVLRNVGQRLTPEGSGDAKKVDEIVKDEVKLATDRYFTPEQRGILAKRMRDVAITVRQRSGDDQAREVLRAAKAIEGAGLITSPPSDLEFLRTFVQKGIALMAQQQGGNLRVPVPNKSA